MGLSHTVSGDIASFRTPSRVPIESMKFHFLPKQATGTPSPENPIPIEGWTGLNGRRAGKNLLKFNKNLYNNPHTAGGITFTAYYNADGSLSHINVKGTKTSNNVFYNLNYVTPGIPMKAGHYIVSGMISGKIEMQAFEYNPNETLILNTSRGVFDFEVHNGNVKSWVKLQVTTDEYIDEDVYPMLMAYPCSDTEYETYSEEQIPITFPDGETIYGGYIDPIAGEIVAEWKKIFLKNGAWYNYSGFKLFARSINKDAYSSVYSSHFPVTAGNDRETNEAIPTYTNGAAYAAHLYFWKDDGNFTSATEFQNWINNLEFDPYVVYKLAEPIHIPIPAQDLKALLDHNNFWSDANDITEVVYPIVESKDILAIKKKAHSFDNYFKGELIFELNGDDPPVDGKWVDRINGMGYKLVGGASYDSANKIYDFSGVGMAIYNAANRDPFNLGHHFRIEWDIYFRRAGTTNGHFFDLGSLGQASCALGIGFIASTSSTITFNWKMLGNASNPFSSTGEARTHPIIPEASDTNYTHFTGFHEIIPWNDGYDRLRIMVNDRIKRYATQIPQLEYTEWRTANGYFSVGSGVYNGNIDTNPDRHDPSYDCDVKIKSIKIYKYD